MHGQTSQPCLPDLALYLIKARRERRAPRTSLRAARGGVLGRRGHSLLPDPESHGNHAHQPAKSASHRPDHTAPRQVPVEPLTRCQGVCAEPPSASRGSKIFSAATSPVHRTVPLAQGVPEPKTSCR
jgi:hypothetical protein